MLGRDHQGRPHTMDVDGTGGRLSTPPLTMATWRQPWRCRNPGRSVKFRPAVPFFAARSFLRTGIALACTVVFKRQSVSPTKQVD